MVCAVGVMLRDLLDGDCIDVSSFLLCWLVSLHLIQAYCLTSRFSGIAVPKQGQIKRERHNE
jgi:hypothetical protein